MKGNEQLIKVLNGLLADELTAINQYVVHSEMAENVGYGKFRKLDQVSQMGSQHFLATQTGE